MFDIGWTELLVVACVAIVVVGPKDLPKMLRTIGKTVGNLKRMASDFQGQFDEALKEAELDEVKEMASGKFAPLEDIKKSTKEFDDDFKKTLAERDAKIKEALDRGEDEPLFPENETSKMLAEKRAKDAARAKAAEKKKTAAKASSTKSSAAKKKTSAKKTSTKKTVKKSSTARTKTAAKKPKVSKGAA